MSGTAQAISAVIHPCTWGDEAPNTPIPLQSPFGAGTNVIPGGVGSFYGDGYHNNYYNDYYATDWASKADGTSTNGMAVYPVAKGVVYSTGYNSDLGNNIVINHDQNVQTTYAHLASMLVHAGNTVSTATQIGVVGSTGGTSTGPHLHLRFRVNGISNWGKPARPSPMDGQKLCDGQPILAAAKAPTTTLSFSVSLLGISNHSGDNNTPHHPNRQLLVQVMNVNNQMVINTTTPVTYSTSQSAFVGTLNLGSSWQSGYYQVRLQLPYTLTKLANNGGIITINNGATTQIPNFSLVNGDIDQNNQIDNNDYYDLVACYGSKQCPPNQKLGSDLNDDGVVDGVDLNIWYRH